MHHLPWNSSEALLFYCLCNHALGVRTCRPVYIGICLYLAVSMYLFTHLFIHHSVFHLTSVDWVPTGRLGNQKQWNNNETVCFPELMELICKKKASNSKMIINIQRKIMQSRAVECAIKESGDRIIICSNNSRHHVKAYYTKVCSFLIVASKYLVHHHQKWCSHCSVTLFKLSEIFSNWCWLISIEFIVTVILRKEHGFWILKNLGLNWELAVWLFTLFVFNKCSH